MPKKKRLSAYAAMAAPAALLFAYFHTWPALNGLFYSFTNWKGFGDFSFIGLKNYALLLQDTGARDAYAFTLTFAFTTTALVNAAGLLLALGLNTEGSFRSPLRAIFFLPNILGTLIVAFVFRFIFSNLLPAIAQAGAWPVLTRNILGSQRTAWLGLVAVTVWQSSALITILYLAGLKTIPSELYEAAKIDGAKTRTRFLRITLPMLAPFVTVNLVLCMKNFLMAFDAVLALTGGGPGTATTSVAVQIWREGFMGSRFAYQSANAVVLFLLLLALSLLQVRLMRRSEEKLHA
jgi:raffinose/stachyose/melibiose transport system permease protein